MIVTDQVSAAPADQVSAQLIPGGVWFRGRYYPPVAGGDETPPTPEPAPTPSPAPAPAPTPEPFDRERAMATIKSLREVERTSKAQAKELDELKAQLKAADDAKLTEQERLEKRVAELEPAAGQVQRYEAALAKHLEVARKDLPAHITALLDKLPVDEQLDWIAANQDAIKPAAGTTAVPGTPRSNGKAQTREQLIEEKKQQLKESGAYTRY